MITIIGGRLEESRNYAAENNLGMGLAHIAYDMRGIRTLRRNSEVRLVGLFHFRPDAKEILHELKLRGIIVKDCCV